MRVEVRYAALDADMERRVRFAVNGLAAQRVRAVAEPWDGTRCNLLVADVDDSYGMSAVDLARRRDTPIIGITSNPDRSDNWALWLGRDATVVKLTRALVAALNLPTPAAEGNGGAASPRPPGTTTQTLRLEDVELRSALARLAFGKGIAGENVLARHSGRNYRILPRNGRLLTTSASELLAVRDRLCDDGWDLRPGDAPPEVTAAFEHAISLDAVCLDAAMRARARLPDFPQGTCWLCDWPDLGQVPELTGALRVARHLLRGKSGLDDAVAPTGLPRDEVNACLWAFAASGLLQHAGSAQAMQPLATQATAPERSAGFTRLFKKLAGHFGLAAR